MSFGLNVSETGRILSVCVVLKQTPPGLPRVDTLPDGDCTEYLFSNGVYVHNPLPTQPMPEQQPSADDRRDAQLTYTAMMTDTLLHKTTQDEEATNV